MECMSVSLFLILLLLLHHCRVSNDLVLRTAMDPILPLQLAEEVDTEPVQSACTTAATVTVTFTVIVPLVVEFQARVFVERWRLGPSSWPRKIRPLFSRN